MDSNLSKNILIVAATLVTGTIVLWLFKKCLEVLFHWAEVIGKSIATRLILRIKHPFTRAVLEILFLFNSLTFIIFSKQINHFLWVFYVFFLIINGSIIQYISKEVPQSWSLLEFLTKKFNTKNY